MAKLKGNGIAVFCFLAVVLGTWVFGAEENLLPNADFENIDGDTISGWELTTKGGAATPSKEGNFTRGTYSAYLKSATEDPDPAKRMPVTIKGFIPIPKIQLDRDYGLTFFARGEKAGQVMKVIYYTDPLPGGDHWYKIKEFTLTTDWKKYTFDERLPGAAEWKERKKFSIAFQIAYGSAFVDDAVLVVKEEAKATAVLRKNLLENPGFDSGLAGWFTEFWHSKKNDTDGRRLERDASVKHSGAYSLKLPEQGASLISRMMQYKPGVDYTLSFYARSESQIGEGFRVFLINPDYKKIAPLKIAATDLGSSWKRFSFAFQGPNFGHPYLNSIYLRVDPSPDNTIWVDSFQLEEGTATDYDPGLQIGLEPSADGIAKRAIYKKGESVNLKVFARSSEAFVNGMRLTLKGLSPDRSVLFSKNFDVPSGKTEVGFDVSFPAERAGVCDLSLGLSSAGSGEKTLLTSEWKCLVIDGPLEVPKNPLVGMDDEAYWKQANYRQASESFEAMTGVGFIRLFSSAQTPRPMNVLPETGTEFIQLAKAGMAPHRAAGRNVMVQIAPDLDSPLGFKLMMKEKRTVTAAEKAVEIPRFARKVGDYVKLMAGDIHMIQILNEPNIWLVGGVKVMPAELYAEVLKAVAAEVRTANPSVKVAANMNGIDFEFVEKLLKLGAAESFDVMTFHSYRAGPENPPIFEDVVKLRALLDGAKKGIPLYNDEQYYGVRNAIAQMEWDRNYFSDFEEDQAGRLVQSALHGIAASRVPFGLFATRYTWLTEGITPAPYYFQFFNVYRTMSAQVRDVVRAQNVDSSKSLRVFLFEREDGTKVVTANTRIYGVKGTVAPNVAAESVCDADGNALTSGAVPVGYLPVYWTFGKNTSIAAIKSGFQTAICRGFEFPVEIAGEVVADGKLKVELRNVGTTPVKGSVKFNAAPGEWSLPPSIGFDLKPGEASENFFAEAKKTFTWNNDYVIRYTAQAEDLVVTRSARIPSLEIVRLKDKVSVDGDLSDWQEARWLSLGEDSLSKNFDEKNPHQGAKDLSAKVAFRWSAEGLYLAADVKDDKVFQDPKAGNAALYLSDSLQIYFDLGNNPREGAHAYDSDDVSYSIGIGKDGKAIAYLEKGTETRFVGENNTATGVDGDVKVAWQKSADGYAVEVFFPAFTLPVLPFKTGSRLGLSLLINDNDGSGRKQGLTLGPKGTEPFSDPWIWRSAKLGE